MQSKLEVMHASGGGRVARVQECKLKMISHRWSAVEMYFNDPFVARYCEYVRKTYLFLFPFFAIHIYFGAARKGSAQRNLSHFFRGN